MNSLKSLFSNPKYYELALTHKSWVNEHPGTRESNERLEFLGDAILEFVVSKVLFEKFKDKEEGYLTALRANIVNTQNLSKAAKRLKLGQSLYLSKGEEEGGGRQNKSLLADTMEAIIGALFLDGGIKNAEDFIHKNILYDLSEKITKPLKDSKSRLQELVQAKGQQTPKYEIIKESGPDHDKKFTVAVIIRGKKYAQGTGKSKHQAEQKAATKALKKLKA